MERAATADFQRDVHLLFEQMYDAIERRMLNRDELRDLTDNLSDVVMPLTMMAAIPVLNPVFSKPELDRIGVSAVEAVVLAILDANFGKTVTKAAIIARVTGRNHNRSMDDYCDAKKLIGVHICKIRKKLRGTPYGIRTDWATGYALDHASKCEVVNGGNTNAARKRSK